MTDNILVKLFEHNNWANHQIIEVCMGLTDAQLDAEPHSATMGSIRKTLLHLVRSQNGYLTLLTVPLEKRHDAEVTFDSLVEVAALSGEALLAVVRGETQPQVETPLRTMDGYFVEPWVVLVQVINHATEHREQIKSMLSALGVAPPSVDGWDYGEATGALVPRP